MGDEGRTPHANGRSAAGEPTAGIDRREFLRAGLDLGLAGGLVLGGGLEYVRSGPAGTITYALARPAPDRGSLRPRRKEVPPVWHESLRLAFSAHERLREVAVEPLLDAAVVPGSYDDPVASLSITATTGDVLGQLEELAGSIPVELDLTDGIVPDAESEFNLAEAHQVRSLEPARVPGGVLCRGGGIYGTLAPAAFDEHGERYFATSNHLFGAGGSLETAHAGSPLALLHDDRHHRIGSVVKGLPAADVALVTPAGDFRPAATIERASPSRVVGQYTKFGLADLAARDAPLAKVGALSDRTAGPIRGVDGLTCYAGRVCKAGQLQWGGDESLTDGDSGSVAYRPDPEHPEEYLLVAGVNNARTRWLGDFTWGTAAYHLRDEYGLHF